jgi:hypothetical protein
MTFAESAVWVRWEYSGETVEEFLISPNFAGEHGI